MAKPKTKGDSISRIIAKPKKKRKGVHAKSKSSSNKRSKNYKKSYGGQGK